MMIQNRNTRIVQTMEKYISTRTEFAVKHDACLLNALYISTLHFVAVCYIICLFISTSFSSLTISHDLFHDVVVCSSIYYFPLFTNILAISCHCKRTDDVEQYFIYKKNFIHLQLLMQIRKKL